MNYTETLNFIHSFKGNGRRPQLERMRWLLKQAGNPQTHFPTVHIVGTNGKGSTTNYLQNILTKSGYQVGTFTSPYITRFNERISINGTEIPDKDLISLVAKAQVLLDDLEEHTAFVPRTTRTHHHPRHHRTDIQRAQRLIIPRVSPSQHQSITLRQSKKKTDAARHTTHQHNASMVTPISDIRFIF